MTEQTTQLKNFHVDTQYFNDHVLPILKKHQEEYGVKVDTNPDNYYVFQNSEKHDRYDFDEFPNIDKVKEPEYLEIEKYFPYNNEANYFYDEIFAGGKYTPEQKQMAFNTILESLEDKSYIRNLYENNPDILRKSIQSHCDHIITFFHECSGNYDINKYAGANPDVISDNRYDLFINYIFNGNNEKLKQFVLDKAVTFAETTKQEIFYKRGSTFERLLHEIPKFTENTFGSISNFLSYIENKDLENDNPLKGFKIPESQIFSGVNGGIVHKDATIDNATFIADGAIVGGGKISNSIIKNGSIVLGDSVITDAVLQNKSEVINSEVSAKVHIMESFKKPSLYHGRYQHYKEGDEYDSPVPKRIVVEKGEVIDNAKLSRQVDKASNRKATMEEMLANFTCLFTEEMYDEMLPEKHAGRLLQTKDGEELPISTIKPESWLSAIVKRSTGGDGNKSGGSIRSR